MLEDKKWEWIPLMGTKAGFVHVSASLFMLRTLCLKLVNSSYSCPQTFVRRTVYESEPLSS